MSFKTSLGVRLRITAGSTLVQPSFATVEALATYLYLRVRAIRHASRWVRCSGLYDTRMFEQEDGHILIVVRFVAMDVAAIPFDHPQPLTETYEAFGVKGKSLIISDVLALGGRLADAARAACRFKAVYGGYKGRGSGPVSGVHQSTSYFVCWYRSISTSAERRMNSLVLREEGEPAPRAARTGHNLPSSWDDISREHLRGWKSQFRGRKAWDRC